MVKNQNQIFQTINRLDPKAFQKWNAREFLVTENHDRIRFTVTGEQFSGFIHIHIIDDFYKITAFTLDKGEIKKEILLETIEVDELIYSINKIING